MLRVNPRVRPDCNKLLAYIARYRNHKQSFQNSSEVKTKTKLLNTIKVPRNLIGIGQKLPQAKYKSEDQISTAEAAKIDENANLGQMRDYQRANLEIKNIPHRDQKQEIIEIKNRYIRKPRHLGLKNQEEENKNENLGKIGDEKSKLSKIPVPQLRSLSQKPQYYKEEFENRIRNRRVRPSSLSYAKPNRDSINGYNRQIREIVNHRRKLGNNNQENYDQYRRIRIRNNYDLISGNRNNRSINYMKDSNSQFIEGHLGRPSAISVDRNNYYYGLMNKVTPKYYNNENYLRDRYKQREESINQKRSHLRNRSYSRKSSDRVYVYKRPDWWG